MNDDIKKTIDSLTHGDEITVTVAGTWDEIDNGTALGYHGTGAFMYMKNGAVPTKDIIDIRVTKRAPDCPFKMGDIVWHKNHLWHMGYEVVEWTRRFTLSSGHTWMVGLKSNATYNEVQYYYPEDLELYNPEPPAGTPVFWRGEWWIKGKMTNKWIALDPSSYNTHVGWNWADMDGAVVAVKP